jgi:hypothetical protein
MNPSSPSQFHNQEALAKEHRQNIIYALRTLKEATSGEIKKRIDKKVDLEMEEKYNSPKYLLGDRKLIGKQRRLESSQKKMSLRTVQKWLVQLQKDYFVSKNKYNVYKLTTTGLSEKIFGESYGKMLFDSITKLPLKRGTPDEKMNDCIRRMGVYVSYVFIHNMWGGSLQRNKTEWINDVINPGRMFEWFNNEFESVRGFDFDPAYAEYATALKETMQAYYDKVFPHLQDDYLDALKRRANELEHDLGIDISS